MRGRRPRPTALKLLAGNPGKRPLNMNEPKPKTGVPTCPMKVNPNDNQRLGQRARKEWFRIVKELKPLGLATQLDRAALHVYAESYARFEHCSEMIQKYGVVIKTPNNFLVQSPYVGIMTRAVEQMQRMLLEFGLTPASRTRLATEASSGQEDPDQARFFEPRPRVLPHKADEGPPAA